MNSCRYYAFDDNLHSDLNLCSLDSDEYPLTVNCAGSFVTPFPFTTDNPSGRADFYLLYLVSGKMDVRLPDGIHEASAGSVMLFPPTYHYRYVYSGDDTLSYLWVHFTGSYARRFLEEIGLSASPQLRYASTDNGILKNFNRIFEIFEGHSPLKRHELACALERLLLSVSLSVNAQKQNPLERSIRYINASYNTDIRIPQLAKMENLSNSRYVALFKEIMGVPPTVYIINLRMSIACELLRSTDMSIQQIGILVGYSDSHFFSKLFKKQVGVAPRYYRSGTN